MFENNVIEAIYGIAYFAGMKYHPVSLILYMPSNHGKSLVSKRFRIPRTLHLRGDVSAQAIRKEYYRLGEKAENINLLIVEDYSKLKQRQNVQDDFASIMGQLASGELHIDQEKMRVDVNVHHSIVICVPSANVYGRLLKILDNAGTGDRFLTLKLKLSPERKHELDILGSKYRWKYPVEPIDHSQLVALQESISFEDIIKESNPEIAEPNELNFKWSCFCINPKLYNNLKDMENSNISEISWEGYWK